MAQRTVTTFVDDFDQNEYENTETVSFGIDGTMYEIDLGTDNAEEFRASLNTFVQAARRSSGPRARRRPTPVEVPTEVEPAAVRAWAKANGITVSPRGRLSASVVAAFRTAGN